MAVRAALLLASCATAAGCLLAPAPPSGVGPGDAGADAGDGGDGGPPPLFAEVTYVKIEAPSTDDQAGYAVALSGDGLTLAIGVPLEDGSATVIDGPVDEAAMAAGAVYVYGYVDIAGQGTWTPQGYLKASNAGAGDRFGSALALSEDGSTLVVGAPGERSDSTDPGSDAATNAGAAYVFVRDSATWSQQGYLKASAPDAGDAFGTSVAVSADGDQIIVGAPLEDSNSAALILNNSANNAGAAYVFARSMGMWSDPAFVKAQVIGAEDKFGTAVAFSGDGSTIAVGAIGDDNAGDSVTDCGAVMVYTATASPTFMATLRAPTPTFNANFGGALALSRRGDQLLVGAVGESSTATGVGGTGTPTATRAGAAFLLVRPDLTWMHVAYIKASNTGVNDQFGASVALASAGASALAGAPGESSGATVIDGDQDRDDATNAGAAYLFATQPATAQVAYLKAPNALANDQFGFALAISDDGQTLAIGAPRENGGGSGVGAPEAPTAMSTDTGAVYVLRR